MRWKSLKYRPDPEVPFCIEVTERQFIEHAHLCQNQLLKLRKAGIKIALDDFGTGYSSITHLLELPIDILKLDRKLISMIDQQDRNQALTAGIIEMAHRLDMTVVAEGVERKEEYSLLQSLGCDHIQGYLIAEPLALDQLLIFLDQWSNPQQTAM